MPRERSYFREPRPTARGFSLVELLVVLAIISIILAVAVPAVLRSRGGVSMTSAAYDLSGFLQEARAYAMANNTYVWVGLYEEDAGAATPTAGEPPYAGHGRVVLCAVASFDGTSITDSLPNATTLPPNRIGPIGAIRALDNVHLTTLSTSVNEAVAFNSRPAASSGAPQGLNSDSAEKATQPFSMGNYTFYKTIRFSPRGEAMINGKGDLYPVVEIGLRPTHGPQVDTRSGDIAAVQLSGIAGNVTIYQP